MDNVRLDQLQERFVDLWTRSALVPHVGADIAQRVYADLMQRYHEPHRRYHGWTHLWHCIEQFELTVARLEQPDVVEMALWFHDAIYVPGASDNEDQSAELFRRAGEGVFSREFLQKVCSFTLLTRHNVAPRESDGCFVVDIDLSSLASGWCSFLRDSDRIREEQSHIPDSSFYPGQVRFLRALLERPRIYYSQFFHDRCEQAARHNIVRLLDGLRSRGLATD